MLISLLLAMLPATISTGFISQYATDFDSWVSTHDLESNISIDSTYLVGHPNYQRGIYYELEGFAFYNACIYDFGFSGDFTDKDSTLSFMCLFNRGHLDNVNGTLVLPYTFEIKSVDDNTIYSNLYLTNCYLNIHYNINGSNAVKSVQFQDIFFNGDTSYFNISDYVNWTIGATYNYVDFEYTIRCMPLNYSSSLGTGYYDQGYNDGYNQGNSAGYQQGYTTGLNEGLNVDNTALTIFSGIVNVGLLPVNIFLQILNVEVFGINIGGLITSFMTIAIVIILWRIIKGSGKSD